MLKVEYSPQALEDLEKLREYLSLNWDEIVSKRVLKKILYDVRRLVQYPLLGTDLGKFIDLPTDYRFLYSEKNYIFYRLEVDTVRIVRILNEKRDYMQQLFGINKTNDNDE